MLAASNTNTEKSNGSGLILGVGLISSLSFFLFFVVISFRLLADSSNSDERNRLADIMYPWLAILKPFFIKKVGSDIYMPQKYGAFLAVFCALQYFIYSIIIVVGRKIKVNLVVMLGIVLMLHLAGVIYLLVSPAKIR